MRPYAWVLAAALASGLAAGTLCAQTTSGGFRGIVRDHNGQVLPGVGITVSSPEMQGVRTAITDRHGVYRFVQLPPGTYRAVFSRPGHRTVEEEHIRIGIGAVVTIKVALKPTSMDEVVVRGDAPMVDVTSAATGDAFSDSVIDNVPVEREAADITSLAAGVVDDGSIADDRLAGNASIMGASALENRWVVDQLETTDPADGGAGTRVSSSFIEELRVTTGGWEAELGGAVGGIVNVITGSGGNEAHGDMFAYFTDDALTSIAKIPEGRGDARTPDIAWDIGFALGGRIAADELWYFVALNPGRLDQSIRQDAFSGTEVDQSNRIVRESEHNNFAGKLTLRTNRTSSLVFNVLGDPTDVTNDVSDTTSNWVDSPWVEVTDLTTNATRGGINLGLNWSSVLSDTASLEAGAGHHRNQDRKLPNLDTTSYQDQTTNGRWSYGAIGNAFFGGAGFQRPTDQRTRDQLRASFTWFLGDTHELTMGGMYSSLEYELDSSTSGPSNAFCAATVAGGAIEVDPATGLERVIPNDCDTSGDGVLDGVVMPARVGSSYRLRDGDYAVRSSENRSTGATTSYSVFAQDSWRARGNLTVNVGIRAETQLSTGDLTDVVPERKLDFGLGDTIAPRLGVVWDPTSTGRSKVYAHYGRIFQATPLASIVRWFGNEHDETSFYEYPESGLPSAANPGALTSIHRASSLLTLVDPNVEPQVLDEVALGGEYEVITNLAVGIRYVNRNLGRVIEGISVDQGQTTFVTNPGGTYDVNPATGVPLDSPVTFPEARRSFDGVEVYLDKRYSDRIQLFTSLLWSRLEGSWEGPYSRDSPQVNPDITSTSELPELLEGAYGPLPNDRTWQVKAYGSYLFRCGLTTGFNFFYLTGTPVSKLGGHRIYGLDERFVTPRGSEGRASSWSNLDLHLGYPFQLGDGDLEVLLDVFNIFDTQVAVEVDQRWTVYAPGDEDVAPGGDINAQTNPQWGKPLAYSAPRNIRVGLKFSW